MKPYEIFEWPGGDQILSQIGYEKDTMFKLYENKKF